MADLLHMLDRARAEIMKGHAGNALAGLEEFSNRVRQQGVPDHLRPILRKRISELHELAESSLRGARKGAADVRAIILAARSLQTYDNSGQRQVTFTPATVGKRY